MKVDIPRSNRNPGLQLETDGVSVLLGANGSGKTGILLVLLEQRSRDLPVVYLDSPRSGYRPNRLSFLTSTKLGVDERGAQAALVEPQGGMSPKANAGLQIAALRQKRAAQEAALATEKWADEGQEGLPPPKAARPMRDLLAKVSALTGIEFDIALDVDNPKLMLSSGGESYSGAGISDGEAQVLQVASILTHVESGSVIAVEEPEMSLHPDLADRLWTTFETERPDLSFVYATHSLSFACRSSVDRVYVLDRARHTAIPVGSVLEEIPAPVGRDLLGVLPGVLRSEHALLVEGRRTSLDREVYEWVLSDVDIAVVPARGCQDVQASLRTAAPLTAAGLASRVQALVDRDYAPRWFSQGPVGEGSHCHAVSRSGVSALSASDRCCCICEPVRVGSYRARCDGGAGAGLARRTRKDRSTTSGETLGVEDRTERAPQRLRSSGK